MGGINSGRKRSVYRGAVEQYPAIDLRVLKRARLLKPGECTYDTLCWRNQGLKALSVRIFVDLSDAGDASLKVATDIAGNAFKQRIAMEMVPCRYGGTRCYFICPLTGTRCELLYLADGIFASRKAHRLTYSAQSEDQLARARRKVRKMQRQVEGDTRYARPRGCNRWDKMLDLREAEISANSIYRERLRARVPDIF